jgi:hypothetical protein
MTRRRVWMMAAIVAGIVAFAALRGPVPFAFSTSRGSSLTAAEVYARAQNSLRRDGGTYHVTTRDQGMFARPLGSQTNDLWLDPAADAARGATGDELYNPVDSILTGEARYVKEADGRFTVTSVQGWTCYGVGCAASSLLGCPGPTERSIVTVEMGNRLGRDVVALTRSGTMTGEDETLAFTRRVFLDVSTFLPIAAELDGDWNDVPVANALDPVHLDRVYSYEVLPRSSLPPDFFDPSALGYTPPDPVAPLNQPISDLAIYWLGSQAAASVDRPPLVLSNVHESVPGRGPGYRFVLNYAAANDPFGPSVVQLEEWPRAVWDARPGARFDYYRGRCWEQVPIEVSSGSGTLFRGPAMIPGPRPSSIGSLGDCPSPPYNDFLAIVSFPRTAIVIKAPSEAALQSVARVIRPYAVNK